MKPNLYLLFLIIASLAGRAVYAQAPTITNFSPGSGSMGTSVILSGSNFTGTTSVRFGEISAPFTVNSSSQITATVPRGASTQLINVTNASGYDLTALAFTVTRANSTLTYSLVTNNFGSVSVGAEAAPAVADLDNDGRLDLLVGRADGTISRYEQTAANATTFTNTGTLSDASGTINMGGRVSVCIVDANGDGKFSVLLGRSDGIVYEYEQTAVNATTFVQVTTVFGDVSTTTYAALGMTSFTGDGELGFLTGKGDNFVGYFGQSGVNSPNFYRINSNYLNLTSNTAPFCIDLDGNGLIDVLIGEGGGRIYRFEQSSANSSSLTQLSTNFNGIDVGANAKPCVTDIDGDGLLDLLVGRADGTIDRYEQGAAPAITNFSANPSAVCVGNQITFTATVGNVSPPYAYTLSNGTSSITGNASSTAFSQNLTASGNGNQTFTLAVNDGGPSTNASINVTVNALPTASLSNNGPLTCSLTSVTLTASGGSSYTFTSPGGAVLGTSGATMTRVVSSPGIYLVRVGNANGCVSTTSTTVISNTAVITTSNPATNTVNINTPFSQSFTATGGVSPYSFSLSSGSLPTGLSLASSGVLSGTPTQGGSFTIVVRGQDANGCFDLGPNYVLTVNATPTITGFNTLDNTVCVGSPITFTATVGNVSGSYNFTVTNGSSTTTGTSANTAFSQNLIAAGSGNQTFTLTINDNSQSASATTSVTINALPTASLTNNGPLTCAQTSVTLTASGGNSYTFTSPGGAVLGTSGATTTRAVSSPGSYSVRVGNANGCVSSTSTTVSSNTAVITTNNPATNTVLINTPFSQTFTATGGVSPYSFSLSSGSLPTGLSLASTGVLSGTPTQGGSFTIVVRGTDANGCSDLSPAYVLTVNAMPTIAGFNTLDNTVCVGSPIAFTATVGNVTGTYNFTLTNGTSSTVSTASGSAFSQNLIAAGSASQTFTLTVGDNGFTATATTTVTINALPTASLTNNGPLTCAQTSVTLTASGGNSYTFTSPGGAVLGTSGATTTRVVSSPGSYSVRVGNASGCVSSTSTTVISNTAVITTSSPATNTVAVNTPFSQTFTASGGVSPYSFSISSGSLPTGLSLASSGVLSGTPTQGGSFTIVVRGQDANGCFDLGPTYVLTVNATPTIAGFNTVDNTVCIGSPITFTATVGNVTGTYNFTLTNGSNSTVSTATGTAFSQNLIAAGSASQSFTLTVGDNGFQATATTVVTINALPTASLTNNGPLTCAQTSVTLTASGGNSYTFTSPGGAVLGTSGATTTRVISSPGSYSVRVGNASGCVSSTSTTVISNTAVITTNNPATNTVLINTPFSQTFTASGGTGPYSFILSSGSLPTGLSLASTGVLSGTPTQGGSFTIVVRGTDANGCSDLSPAYVLTVNATPTITGFNTLDNTVCVGSPITFTATVGNVTGGYNYTLTNGTSSTVSTASGSAFSQNLIAAGSASQTFTLTVGDNGFTATATTSVTINALPTASLTNNGPLTCAQTSVTLTASGGNSYTFTSPGGAVLGTSGATTTRVVSSPGSYSVRVGNASGCVSSTSTTVISNTAVITTSSPATNTVAVNTPFSQTFTASGGVSPYSFSITTGTLPTGLSLTNTGVLSGTPTQGGSFTITVRGTDANGCSDLSPAYVLTVNATPTIAGFNTLDNTVCVGSPLTFTATVGNVTGSYNFTLTNGTSSTVSTATGTAFSQNLTAAGSNSQSFTLTVGDNGFTATAITTVTVNTLPTATLVSSGILTCAQTSVTLTASGGTSYTFTAPGGTVLIGSGNTRTVSSPGAYSVTVANASGCMSTTSTSVFSATAVPTVSISPNSATLTCTSPTATLTAVGSGSVLWSTGETTPVITVNVAGTYSVTLTNGSGCVATASTSVFSNTAVSTVSINPSSATLTCASPTASLTAVGSGSVLWSTGEMTPVISVNAAGTYSVTLTNGSGCVATASTTVFSSTAVPTVSISPNSATLTCASPTASLTAIGSGTVRWSTGETTPVITVNAVATYSVTLTNGSGCVATASTSVFSNTAVPTVSINPSSATLTCASSTASLTAIGSGTVRWSTGETTPVISVNAAGTYSVTLTNGSGCVATASTTVFSATAVPTVSINPSSATLTCASPTATLTAIGSGTIRWSTGETTPVISVNAAGTYSVTLTNGSGCVATANASVFSNTAVSTVSINPSSVTLTCASPTASLTAVSSGTVRWNTGETTPVITVNAAGTYSVTLTNGSGCVATASTTVFSATAVLTVSINPSSATLTCASPTATLTAVGSGSVLWSTGETTPVITVNAAGTYSVTLTNGSGCVATASTTVFSNTAVPSVSISPSSVTLTCASPTASLTAVGSGSVLWSTGETTPVITVNAAGTYSVTLTNGSGCTATASTTVFSSTAVPTVSISPSSATLTCASPTASLTAIGSDSVLWSTGETTPVISVNAAGTYSVTLTNGNGCVATASTTVFSSTAASTVSINPSSVTLTCATPTASLTAIGSGTVRWSTGETTPVISVNATGTYSVTLTNGSGCVATASTTVFSSTAASTVSISPSSATLTCATPTASLTAIGSGTVRWSTGETTPVISVNAAGIYSVTLTNGNGCVATASVNVSQDNTATSVSIIAAPSLTIAQGQTAILTASATGNAPFSYAWSTTQSTPAISVNTGGTYSVTVTGTNGCSATASATVSVTMTPVVSDPFAITSVLTLDCTPVLPNRYSVSFTPQYSGLNGQPLSFSIANELLPTTSPGPYTLQLYTDNPTLTLRATQPGTPAVQTSFSYNWLAACQASVSTNTPPRLVMSLPPQSATVGVGFTYVIPAGTFTDDQTPGSLGLTAAGLPAGLSLTGYSISGSPSTTVGSPFSVSITATDPGGLSVSTSLVLSVSPGPVSPPVNPSQPFSLTGVSLLFCTPVADRINISFVPQYAGTNGQAIAFSVVNELAPTSEPGPYSLTLYRDNPVLRLRATQTGNVSQASFDYNWLVACASLGADNTPPRVVSPVGPQSGTVGVGYSVNLSNVFADQETPSGITITASGLPAGLSLVGTAISGTPSGTGTSTITLTASDPGALSVSTSFVLTVSGAASVTVTPPPTGFAITGVQTLSCVVVSGGQRRVSFTPQYTGLTGQAVTFGVANELAATSAPGPYTLNLYTDNPVITLRASQAGSGGEASYAYNWLAACGSGSRLGAELESTLRATVLGNPVTGQTVLIRIEGAQGQSVRVHLSTSRGHSVVNRLVEVSSAVHEETLSLGNNPGGIYVLRVSAGGQTVSLKVVKE